RTGLQNSRDASEQIAQAVLDTGHGLVLQSKGLNTTHKLAVRDGVPAGLIFRDFDSADQTPSTIRRFLDQAAFRAAQEGGVIMVGRVRPDTISALLLWGLQDRAERVALAPISAVLTALVPAPE
ncbi:divergent polysaccharide deacetylase family protein, partial [Tateyamaria sp.]